MAMLLGASLYGYAAVSAVVTGAVIANAVSTREQFYGSVVHLCSSKGALMAICNMVVVVGLLLGKLVKKMFLGSLRDPEVEHLNERIWPTITDTLLMMTIFRDEIGFTWGALFGILVFLRVFTWLAADRVAYIEVNPNMTRNSYLRLISMLVSFMVFDGLLLYYCAVESWAKGPSQLLMFGFEYTLIMYSLAVSLVKFFFNVVDANSPGGWDNKGVCVLYLDFFSDFLRLITYGSFFTLVCYNYGLPLHIVRQTWLSVRSFRKSFEAVSKYRRATANMDQRFPDATQADLQRFDNTCVVCREEIQEGGKKLPCQHVLHLKCLKRWLESSHTCPTCSRSVFIEDVDGAGGNQDPWGENNENNDNNDPNNNNNDNFFHPPPRQQRNPNAAAGVDLEPIDRTGVNTSVRLPAVVADLPQVVDGDGRLNAEHLLLNLQLLQEQIGLLSDQVAVIQAQILSAIPLTPPSPPSRMPPAPVVPVMSPQPQPAPAATTPTPAAAPQVAPQVAPQATPSPAVVRQQLASMPVTDQEREYSESVNAASGDQSDAPLDELRRRRLQRFRTSKEEEQK